MAGRGIQVVITGEYNDKDVKKAMADLRALQSDTRNTGNSFGVLGSNVNGFTSTLGGSFTSALTGVGAAIAGAFAVEKIGRFFEESISAAMEDEKSLVALAKAMDNVGLASQNAQAEGLIKSMSMQFGIADDQLRPAFQRLVTATKDVGESQKLLQTALDISAAGYTDLESAAKALSAASMGNFTALQRLKLPLDANTIAAKDFEGAIGQLNATVGGQAAAAADTYAGKMTRIKVAVDEAKESIGYSLLHALDNVGNSLGGTDGAVSMIQQLGNGMSGLITQVGQVVSALSSYSDSQKKATEQDQYSEQGYRRIVQLLPIVGSYLSLLSNANENTARSTALANDEYRGYSAAIAAYDDTAHNAISNGYALADSVGATGKAATEAAAAVAFLQDNITNLGNVRLVGAASDAFSRSFLAGGGGGTPTSGYTDEYAAGVARNIVKSRKAMQDAAARAASSSASKAAKEYVTLDYANLARDINKQLDGLSVTISGKGEKVTKALAAEFKDRTDAFVSAVKEQQAIIESAQNAISSYSDSISSTILGRLSFKTAAKDAEGNDVNLSPDAIARLMLGDIANQSKAVGKIAGIALKLPDALTKQILGLPADAAIALADYLSANPDLTNRLTENYNALAEQTKTLLGDPMAQAFATVGGKSAVALIAGAREAIASASSEFQAWASSALHVTIGISSQGAAAAGDAVASAASSALDAALAAIAPTAQDFATSGGFMGLFNPLAGRASGGPVAGGTPYMVGENGPEVFVPGISGTIIPNAAMSASSGNSYAITVNSGVGDPRQIGQDIVQYIRLFEQSSGRVFAKA